MSSNTENIWKKKLSSYNQNKRDFSFYNQNKRDLFTNIEWSKTCQVKKTQKVQPKK